MRVLVQMMTLIRLLVLYMLCIFMQTKNHVTARDLTCEEISVPLCKGIGYNYTYMPNSFKHDTQDEAGLEVHQFWPLVEIRCSPDMRFFLCSMYTPICLKDYGKPLPPCRSVCERARAGCAPLMKQYGFPWPERMKCDLLPVQGDPNNLCMDYNRTGATSAPPKPTRQTFGSVKKTKNVRARAQLKSTCEPTCQCRAPMVTLDAVSQIKTGGVKNCAMPCNSPYVSGHERAFMRFWIGLWSILCFISTCATVVTFVIDSERFKYPERPIIFMSACYLFVSTGYIVRLAVGHENVACDGDSGAEHVRYESTGPALCTLVFLLVYFFGMASSLWWVILSLTWFLAAGMKWSSEAISSYSLYFHLAAWIIPSVKCVVVLALSAVDGDSVSGICYVGNQNLENLRGFVLAPLLIYLFVGTVFLIAGLVSLFRIRRVIKQVGKKTDKLERLMMRMGVFTVLHTVPAAVIVVCYLYEQHNRETWESERVCSCETDQLTPGPHYSVFMLRYCLSLLVGITSGAWVWSGKTLNSWRAACTRCYWRSKRTSSSLYSDTSTGLTWRSGTASSVSCPPKHMPLSRV